MKFKEFCTETQRTLPDLDLQYQLTNGQHKIDENPMYDRLPKDLLNRIHMELGICSETHELIDAINKGDKVNISEELVDKLWYIANSLNIAVKSKMIMQDQYNIDLNYQFGIGYQVTDGGKINTTGVATNLICIVYNVSKLQEFTKKYLAYEKPIVAYDYCKAIHFLLGAINNLAYDLHIDLEEGMDRVIAKLRARYPKAFNLEEAINRDLEEERRILEGINTVESGAGDDNPIVKEVSADSREPETKIFSAMQEGTD